MLLALPAGSRAQDMERAARELTQKILAGAGEHPSVALTVWNLSSLRVVEVVQVCRALEAELRAQGARLVEAPPADVEARVTLSENLQGYLWVAEIHRGQRQQVVMLALGSQLTGLRPRTRLTLERNLLWSQRAPILDLLTIPAAEGERHLLVLEPDRLALYSEGREELQAFAFPWPPSKPLARDPRGRLSVTGKDLRVFLPGMVCLGKIDELKDLKCEEGDEPWPLKAGSQPEVQAHFSPLRNFFDGRLEMPGGSKKTVSPFYSAAAVAGAGGAQWIFAGLDGRAHLDAAGLEELGTIDGWGSDLVGLATGCQSGWQVLAPRASDWTQPDTVQAFEIVDRQAVTVSDPVEFAGPVMALWSAPGGGSAYAVVRSLKSGEYEAYSLSISCGH